MKVAVLVRKLLGVSVVTRSRLGFLVATVLVVTIVGKVALTEIQALESIGATICIGIGAAGFLSWGAGWWMEARRARLIEQQNALDENRVVFAEDVAQDQNVNLEGGTSGHPLAFLWSCKYWGIILIVSGAILTCIATYPRPKPVLSVRARPPLTNGILNVTNCVTITNVVTITNAKPVVTFPALKLAGLVVNGKKSAALINGRVLQVGEKIGDVLLVAVDGGHATVGLAGETKVLALGK